MELKQLAIIAVIFLVACTGSSKLSKDGNSMPGAWSVLVPLGPNVCPSIDGDYQILGMGKLEKGLSLTQTSP